MHLGVRLHRIRAFVKMVHQITLQHVEPINIYVFVIWVNTLEIGVALQNI